MEEDLDAVLYQEQQRFRELYTWVILVGVSAFLIGTVVWMIMRQVVQDKPFGPEAISDGALLGLGGIVIVLNLFYVLRYALATLQIEVTRRGLFVRYWPRQQKVRQIDLTGVTGVQEVTYRPYLHYGGRGLKRQRRAVAYSVAGTEGVRIDYDNGVHVLIGARDPGRLAEAIRRAAQHVSKPEERNI